MSAELERSISKLFDMSEDFSTRLTRLEENVKNQGTTSMEKITKLDASLAENTKSVHALEIRIAYAAGAFALIVIIAQVVIQILTAVISSHL